MRRPTLTSETLEIVPKDAPLSREPIQGVRESGSREPVELPPPVIRAVLTCRMPEPLLDRLSEAAHHYRKKFQKQDLIEQALDAWLTSKGF